MTNGGAVATQDLQIVDELFVKSGNTFVTVATATVDVSSNPVLDPNERGCYPYRIDITPVAGATYKNTAHITITNHSGNLGAPSGPDPSNTTDFPGAPTPIDDSITVDDSNGKSWTFTGNANQTYDQTFQCAADSGAHKNVVSTTLADGSTIRADATVTVNCYALEVKKDATTSFKRTYNWKIDKSVSPETWGIFLGDDATSKYTIAAEKTGHTDSEWAVEGKITVHNPAPMAASINKVTDVVSPATSADVDCGVTFPYSLGAGATLECSYKANLPNSDDRTNKATATLLNIPSGTTDFSGTAEVKFGDPTTEANTKINVDDSNGGSWEFSDSGSVSYKSDPFTCEELGSYTRDNTATIRETEVSDTATVTVNCYDPVVTKDASTSLTRTYNWTIDKAADQSSLTLSVNQSFPVNYAVTANATSTDSDWAVSGNIEVYNSAPIAALINSVTDQMSGVGAVEVKCPDGITFPYLLSGGATLKCTYHADLTDATDHTNIATATQQNYSYDPDGNATPSGTYDYTGSADVTFDAPTINPVDECIAVDDSFAGSLGTVCYGVDPLPQKIEYAWSVGAYTTCGDYKATNTATFTTQDTGATGSDSWTIDVKVPCQGCTLTIGYWKTHAGFGPQADKVTALLPQLLGKVGGTKTRTVSTAADAVQYLSFKGSNNSFDAANGINKLYAQLLAAKLNIANGAGGSVVAPTITAADNFLASNDSAAWASLTRSQKNQVNAWAGILDQYNNGLIGPSHCSEEGAVAGVGTEGLDKRLFLPTVLNQE